MSPASQPGGLHVERYLGSYLISNSQRGKVHPDYDGPGGLGKAAPKPPQYAGGSNIYRGGYCPSDGIFCPPPYCQNRNSWAGVPLISTAHHRRNGKPHALAASRPAPHTPPFHHQRMPLVNPPCNLEYGDGQHLPLSKLALHTRGAPLILSRRYNNNNNANRKQNQYHNNSRQYTPPANRAPVVPDIVVKKPREVVSKENRFEYKDSNAVAARPNVQNGHLALNIDSLSVTSDESSGSAHSETCLPRIIKPRKRRKKDRKPLNNGIQEKTSATESKDETPEPASDSTIVSLNPYIPVYNERTDINHNTTGFKPLLVNSNLLDYVKLYDPSDQKTSTGDEWKFLPSKENSQRTPTTSDSSVPNSNDIEDDESDDSSSLFEAISRCSPTICQCRYCDPSGQIWDIDQHCYSPILKTPVDLGVDDKTIIMEKDTVLRRSWSEPCPGYSVENLRISEYDKRTTSYRSDPNISIVCDNHEQLNKSCNIRSVGVIGAGRRPTQSKDSPSTLDWKEGISPKSSHFPETLFKSSSSHGVSLEVSSAIVTSLNGHRDLEIKFFSTSPTAVVSEAASFVYPSYKQCDEKSFESVVSDANSKCESTDVLTVTG